MGKLSLGKYLETDVLSIVFLTAFLLAGEGRVLLFMLGAILIHECGHLLPILLFRVPIRRLILSLTGADIATGGTMSYPREMLVLAGGGMFNLFAAFLAFVVWNLGGSGYLFCCVNLLYALFNFLPVTVLDGGKILNDAVLHFCGVEMAYRISRVVSFITLALLWCVGAGIFLRSSLRIYGGFSLGSSLFFLCLLLLGLLTKNEKK